MEHRYDLLIRGGRLIDPAQGIDAVRDVGIREGRVAALGDGLPGEAARRIIEAAGCIVAPGLIDLHTHVFSGLYLSVEADPLGARSGVTTMVDAGSAGAGTFALFREQIVRPGRTRIVPFLSIWATGFATASLPAQPAWSDVAASADAPIKPLAYFDEVRFASVEAARHVIEEHRELIAGVKVWVNRFVAGGSLEPLLRALQVADATGLPLMVCTYFAPPSMEQILAHLRPGDMQTHVYGAFTDLVRADGTLLPAAAEARRRGVVFDVGHGAGSFDFQVCRRALDLGFAPDVISTDIHSESIHGPVYDLPTTMAKFMALGMSLGEVIRATTQRPAEVLGMADQIGSLRPGMAADVALFDLVGGEYELVDAEGQRMVGTQRLENRLTVRRGHVLCRPGDE